MKNLMLTAPLLALVVIAACVDAPPVATDSSDGADVPRQASIAYGPAERTLANDENAESHRTEYARLRARLLEIVNRDEPFAARDDAARAMITDHRLFPLTGYLRQFVAVHFLRELLDAPRPEHTPALAYHTDVLLDEGSPEAALIHRALRKLDSDWSKDRIGAAAGKALENALAWAERVCADCSPDAKVAPGSMAAGRPDLVAKRSEVMNATLKLRKLASP